MSNELAEQEGVEIIMPPEKKSRAVSTVEDNSPAGFVRLAIEKNLDTDKLRELMALEKEWRADQAKAAFDYAMAEFNKIKPTIKHNRKGTTAGHASYTYSDFPEMAKIVTPLLGQCGLSFMHYHTRTENGEYEVCRVSHEAGHSQENDFPILLDERLKGKVSPMQLRQLAATYAKRQSLAEALGLATEEDKTDDDSRKPVALITEQQAADLTALMGETVNNTEKFLKWLKVEKVEDLPARDYKRAVNQCEKLRKGE